MHLSTHRKLSRIPSYAVGASAETQGLVDDTQSLAIASDRVCSSLGTKQTKESMAAVLEAHLRKHRYIRYAFP